MNDRCKTKTDYKKKLHCSKHQIYLTDVKVKQIIKKNYTVLNIKYIYFISTWQLNFETFKGKKRKKKVKCTVNIRFSLYISMCCEIMNSKQLKQLRLCRKGKIRRTEAKKCRIVNLRNQLDNRLPVHAKMFTWYNFVYLFNSRGYFSYT